MTDVFAGRRAVLPRPFDGARAARTFAALAECPDGFVPAADARAVLESAFGNSPYLARLALRDPRSLQTIVETGPRAALDASLDSMSLAATAESEAQAMAILRSAKREAALAVALADIAGLWSLEDVTGALTEFADRAVSMSLRFLLRTAAVRHGMADRDTAHLEGETGLVVIAMGKYGAFELNYSSDIDLIVFYDAARFPFAKNGDPRSAAVDIVRGLVRMLAEITADGYVFRVDLRLRPDAGATQVAISTAAAEDYYEGMGQNWERAALIKARSCAGDHAAAARFLKTIEPFVWRRNLDFAAIEDIHSIKRQIHAHGGFGDISVAGHNIKLGRGGIREIEFFAQTQQLILGGRNPTLRQRGTLDALQALCKAGHVSEKATADLSRAYRFLRTLEHRLQMIEDEQTHTLPKTQDGLEHIACFDGFSDVAAFGAAVTAELESVQDHYAHLFERAPPLASARGNLVFTGVEDDPDTIETLGNMGFKDPRHVASALRGWHHGRIRATRSSRARELLTNLVPALLDALAATADPDAAFVQFDRFLSRLPAGVQLFSLFLANPHLLDLIATIAGSAPKLADHMARSPATLDALLDPDFFGSLPARKGLDQALGQALASAPSFEGSLDAARRFAREQIFRVGAQVINGAAPAEAAGEAFTQIAESLVAAMLSASQRELERLSGSIESGTFVVIAMGKLGGREMTANSDLDLIFVYDAPSSQDASDGPKSLPIATYYGRLAQRLISSLTVATGEGGLYEVDMRLRPTGNAGPVAVSFESFRRYHSGVAWTWEHLALTRARVIAGPPALADKTAAVIRMALSAAATRAEVVKDAREMRDRLAQQFPGRSKWDLKFTRGGLVDIEFIAQTLQLLNAPAHPDVLNSNTVAALTALARAGALGDDDAAALIEAARLQQSLSQILRIAIDGVLEPDVASEGLKALLVRAGKASDFVSLELALMNAQNSARAIFERLLAKP